MNNPQNIFKGIEHPAIAVENLAEMTKWYCQTLGYKLWFGEENGSVRLLQSPDGILLELMKSDGTTANRTSALTKGFSHLALKVDDFDQAINYLTEQGVQWQAEEGKAAGGGRLRNFYDPEGNLLQLVSR